MELLSIVLMFYILQTSVTAAQDNITVTVSSVSVKPTTNITPDTITVTVPSVSVKPTTNITPGFNCPSTWVNFGEYCYLVLTEPRSFMGSRNRCRIKGGQLASIHSTTEQEFIYTLLQSYPHAYYFGLNDITFEGNWEFIDGSEVNFTNWKIDEPNNSRNEDCAALSYFDSGLWNDVSCRYRQGAVCQMYADNTSQDDQINEKEFECPDNWSKYDNSCYNVYTEGRTFMEAKSLCRINGGELASIHSAAEQEFINILIQPIRMGYFFGLNDVKLEGVWKYIDESEVDFLNWKDSEPDNEGNEDCAIVSHKDNGLWKDVPCRWQYGAICQINKGRTSDDSEQIAVDSMISDHIQSPISVETMTNSNITSVTNSSITSDFTCPNDWSVYGEWCYYISNQQYTFWRSGVICRTRGGELASIHSEAEQTFIHSILEPLGHGSFYFGLNDKFSEGIWHYADDTEVDYFNWNVNEPGLHKKEDCVEVSFDDNGRWNDVSCRSRKGSICQRKADRLEKSTNSDIEADCSRGWIAHNGSWYCYVDDATTWNDARAICQAHGAHLVSIESEQENQFVKASTGTFPGQYMWIGFNDIENEGIWIWDGSWDIPNYANWEISEPNNSHNEDCAVILRRSLDDQHNIMWHDNPCCSEFPFICEKDV